MNKEQVLAEIKRLSLAKEISRDEINTAFEQGSGNVVETQHYQKNSVTDKANLATVLYYIGGAIVLIGIVVLLSQNWSSLSLITKILVTFGSGIVAYIAGVLFLEYGTVSSPFFLIAAFVTPIGLNIIFDNLGWNVGYASTQIIISTILCVEYVVSHLIFKKTIFTFFSIVFGTWLFYSICRFFIGTNPYASYSNVYLYITMIVGLSYIFLGYSFAETKTKDLTGPLYSFGCIFLLGAALSLGGIWDVLSVGMVFGVILLSVYLKSKSFLTFGALFLIAYLFKITYKYFSQSLGWSLALVIAGLLLIGVGYLTFYLNKKYVSVK